jgi:hypothetical protein
VEDDLPPPDQCRDIQDPDQCRATPGCDALEACPGCFCEDGRDDCECPPCIFECIAVEPPPPGECEQFRDPDECEAAGCVVEELACVVCDCPPPEFGPCECPDICEAVCVDPVEPPRACMADDQMLCEEMAGCRWDEFCAPCQCPIDPDTGEMIPCECPCFEDCVVDRGVACGDLPPADLCEARDDCQIGQRVDCPDCPDGEMCPGAPCAVEIFCEDAAAQCWEMENERMCVEAGCNWQAVGGGCGIDEQGNEVCFEEFGCVDADPPPPAECADLDLQVCERTPGCEIRGFGGCGPDPGCAGEPGCPELCFDGVVCHPSGEPFDACAARGADLCEIDAQCALIEGPDGRRACVANVMPAFCGGFGGFQCPDDQYCEYEGGGCGFADGGGQCQDRPFACAEIFAPVCGCDGNTYGNECIAHSRGVDVLHDGECEGPGPDPIEPQPEPDPAE